MPVGRNKLTQFRQPYGKRTAAMPELRKLVPAYILTICVAPSVRTLVRHDSRRHPVCCRHFATSSLRHFVTSWLIWLVSHGD